nr:GNAT family N-acetyltransferase [Epibacterium ulvae]
MHRFETDTSWMPKEHSGAEAISFCGTMIDRGWVTVAERAQQILGFLARDGDEICALYVAPEAQGQGIGSALLNEAMTQVVQIMLWTFQVNVGAQRFYLRHGFVETTRTDGQGNAENLSDIAYVWTKVAPALADGSEPVGEAHREKEHGA